MGSLESKGSCHPQIVSLLAVDLVASFPFIVTDSIGRQKALRLECIIVSYVCSCVLGTDRICASDDSNDIPVRG